MTTMPSKHRNEDRLPRVGVFAITKVIATSLARELGIARPIFFSPKAFSNGRGVALSALLVDEEVWPLEPDVAAAMMPCLAREKGYILRVMRMDPHTKNRKSR